MVQTLLEMAYRSIRIAIIPYVAAGTYQYTFPPVLPQSLAPLLVLLQVQVRSQLPHPCHSHSSSSSAALAAGRRLSYGVHAPGVAAHTAQDGRQAMLGTTLGLNASYEYFLYQ